MVVVSHSVELWTAEDFLSSVQMDYGNDYPRVFK